MNPLELPDSEVEELPRPDARRWFNAWCEAFLTPVRLRIGAYRFGEFHWHAFSFELVPARHGQAALDAYSSCATTTVLVIPESWETTCGARVSGLALPDLGACREDLYVFPESLEWTMAFTHEQPRLGPYFTRREWCGVAGQQGAEPDERRMS